MAAIQKRGLRRAPIEQFLCLCALWALTSVANATCYKWTRNSVQYDTLTALATQMTVDMHASSPAYTYTITSATPDVATSAGVSGTVVIHAFRPGFSDTDLSPENFTSTSTPGTCPPPSPCTEDPYTFTASNVSGPNQYCNKVNSCKMYVTNRTGDTMTIHQSGESCDPYNDTTGGSQPDSGDPGDETCQSIGDGEYCASPSGDGQCGYLNDTYVCLDKIKPDECVVSGSGARLCGPAADTTPPVPDNGTAGQLATPDDTLAHDKPDAGGGSNVTNYNYYGGGTVSGSERDAGTSGGGRSSGAGASPGEGPSEEQVGEAIGEPATIDSESHDLSTALDENLIELDGSCPDPTTVTVFGSNIELDAITQLCTLAGMISGLVLAGAWLTSILIVARGL